MFVGLRPLVSQKPLDGNRLQRSFFPAADTELAGKTVALLPMTLAVEPRLGKKKKQRFEPGGIFQHPFCVATR